MYVYRYIIVLLNMEKITFIAIISRLSSLFSISIQIKKYCAVSVAYLCGNDTRG